MKKNKINYLLLLIAVLSISFFSGCGEDEENFPRTRLFKPVLRSGVLEAEANTIIVNISKQKDVEGYLLQVSRDTFQTIDYTFEIDTTYVVINEDLIGEELLWSTIYQVRATALADASKYNSRTGDFWSVRTEKFPSNMIAPEANDVIDKRARVEWIREGDPIDEIRVFDGNDARLERPVIIIPVSDEEEAAGEKFVPNLLPQTTYQIALYSDGTLRGWERFTTLVALVKDKNSPTVIDLTGTIDPAAAENAYMMANDGDTILLGKGIQYNLPGDVLADKSITFIGDLGFEERLAQLYTTGNWNVMEGAVIDHLRYVNLEIYGEDFTGDYIMNLDASATINEISYISCHLHDFRGLMRMKDNAAVNLGTYRIEDCIVNQIGGYGIITVDNQLSQTSDIELINSTFYNIEIGITTYTNTNSVTIDGITTNNFPLNNRWIFRYRNAPTDESLNGISISNSIFGHAKDPAAGEDYAFPARQGLDETNFAISNVYGTADFEMDAGSEISGMPSSTYSGDAVDLWENPEPDDDVSFDFNFKDTSFSGRTNAGDPRWRTDF